MDLSVRQTRQLLLAGTVPFPRPFPSAGTIWFEEGSLIYDRDQGPKGTQFVLIQERCRGKRSSMRGVLQSHATALFVPGRMRSDGCFRISRRKWVADFERGEWFFDDMVNARDVVERLKLPNDSDVTTPDSVLRGIVFVRENRPVVSVAQSVRTARELSIRKIGFCTSCWEHSSYCTCDRCTPDR